MEQSSRINSKLPKVLTWLRHNYHQRHPEEEPLVPLATLRQFPKGTFGKAWADFVDHNQLTPFDYGFRRSQLHDGVHVLTGYGVDALGEAQVQAFLLGTKWHPINLIFGLALSRKARQEVGRTKSRQSLITAYQRGHASVFDPDTWQPQHYWHLPLETVQAKFQIRCV
jgi:ubiquinone biosynthesis protein Coq4